MKSAREYFGEHLDELAIKHHKKYYNDLSRGLQQTIWSMADRDYNDYLGGYIDYVCDTIEER